MDQPIKVLDCTLFAYESSNLKAPRFKNYKIEMEEEVTLKPGDVLSASLFDRKLNDRKGLSIQILKRGEEVNTTESSDDTPDFIEKMNEEGDDLPF